MINNFGAYLGMGLLAVTVALFYFLATRNEKKDSKKSKIIIPR